MEPPARAVLEGARVAAVRPSVAVKRDQVKSVVRVAAGNFLEMYDFMIYGYYAAAIGRAFFPKGSELRR
jgi:hypothetical protein